MTDLDALDARIVAILRADGRASYAEIGEEVNLSAPAVKRRVDRLLASGAIRGFTAVVDPAALGWGTEAFVELYCVDRTSPAAIRSSLAGYPEVISASTVSGEPDAVLHLVASDVAHLERVVEKIGAERFVARTKSLIVLSPLLRRPAP